MSLKSEMLSKAFEIKKNEKQAAENFYEQSLLKAKENNPEIEEIELALSKIGAQTMFLSLSGKTDELEACKQESQKLLNKKQELLKKAGVIKPSAVCPICEDNGYENGKPCRCVKEIAKLLMVKKLSDTTPINDCTFESFSLSYYPEADKNRMEKLFTFCKDYAENFNTKSQSLLFLGKSGLGKTHLSLAIAKRVIENGFEVLYGSAQNIFGSIEKEHFSYSGNSDYLDTALNCELLIIDDLGAEFSTAFTLATLYNLINTRILSGKPTIISTNLSFDELEERYTARITSRFIGEYALKKFAGNDIRQIKALKRSKS